MAELSRYVRSISMAAAAFSIFLNLPSVVMGESSMEVASPNKSVSATGKNGGAVVLSGRWKPVKAPKYFLLPTEVNTVRIYCDRPKKVCTESIAYVRIDDDKKRPVLDVLDSFEYKIVQWTDAKIVAVCKGLAENYELNISLKEKTAERVIRTTAEDEVTDAHTTADSPAVKWILE